METVKKKTFALPITTQSSTMNESILSAFYPLYRAAKDGDIQVLQNAINQGKAINSKWMLFVAIKNSKKPNKISDTVKLILEQEGTNPNQRDYDNRTPLYWAVEKWHQATVKTLIEHDADPYIADNKGETPFHLAARHADMYTMEILLSKNLKPVIFLNAEGKSPLCIIAENDRRIVSPEHVNRECINPPGVRQKLLESFFDPVNYIKALRLATARNFLPPIKHLLNYDISNVEDSAKECIEDNLGVALSACNFNKPNWPEIISAFLERGVNLESATGISKKLKAKLKDVDNVGKIIAANDSPEKQILCALSLLEYSVDKSGIKEHVLKELYNILPSIKDTNQDFIDQCLQRINHLSSTKIHEDLSTTFRLAAFNENDEITEQTADDVESVVLDVKELGESLPESITDA